MASSPRILERSSPEELLAEVRREVEEAVRPGDRILVPTGRTPSPLYAQIRTNRESRKLWASLQYLQLDEYIDPPEGTEPFSETLSRELFDPIGVPEHARGAITNPEASQEGARLDQILAQEGPIRLCLLGMGQNGHIAFNEPGDETPGYHVVTLSPETVKANFPQARERGPIRALTIGIDQIFAAEKIFLWVPQTEKQDLLDRVLAGPRDRDVPATALLGHPDWTVFRLRR